MTNPLINKIYSDTRLLSEYLSSKGEISFQTEVDDKFKKVLLLAVASFLENQISALLVGYSSSATNNCIPLISFIKNKAINRQYHTYFNWEERNANQFFGLFGNEFSQKVKLDIKVNNKLEDAIKAFLEIGNERNSMVHENFAAYSLSKTAEEIFILYNKAQYFVDYLTEKLDASISQ